MRKELIPSPLLKRGKIFESVCEEISTGTVSQQCRQGLFWIQSQMIPKHFKEGETEMNSMLLRISRYMLPLVLVVLPTISSIAMPAVNVGVGTRHVELINAAEYLEDPTGKLTFDNVRLLPSDRFSRLTQDNYIIKSVTSSTFWIRFAVRNVDSAVMEWIVQHGQPFTDYVDFWIMVDGKVIDHAVGGDRTILAERQVPYSYPAARHISLPGELSQVYMRLHNAHPTIVRLVFTLESDIEFIRRSTTSQSLLGVRYGIPLVLAFFALIGWALSRDRSLAMYGLYALVSLASWLGLNGELVQYVFVDSPTLANNAWHALFLLSVAFGTMFARDFLHTRDMLPRMDRSMRLLIWIAIGGVALRVMGVYTLVAQLMLLVLGFFYMVSPVWGWYALRRGIAYARWYMVAQLSHSLVIATFFLMGLGVLHPYDEFFYPFIGIPFIAELLLLAVAQHDRTRYLQRDKKKLEHDSMEAISRSEARLRTMADYLPILIAYIDKEERYRFCNLHHETVMHLKPDELLGKRICDVMGKDNYVKIASQIQTVWNGQTVSFERSIEKSGVKQYIQYKYIPDIERSGESGGLCRTFADEGIFIAELVQAVSDQRQLLSNDAKEEISAEYLTYILDACDKPVAVPSRDEPHFGNSQSGKRAILSDREVEILKLVAMGLKNSDLAMQLYLSESTVKWHLQNIYAKLRVNSRTGAIAKMRALSIL